jgi:hypothetical protein
MFDPSRLFHAAMVVADLDAAMADLAATSGYRWASPMAFVASLGLAEGVTRWDMRVAYSTEGAQLLELIEARRIEGTSAFYDLAPGEAGRLHHVGGWSHNLDAESAAMAAAGAPWVATVLDDAGNEAGLRFHTTATGLITELIDAAGRTGFEAWLAGGAAPG